MLKSMCLYLYSFSLQPFRVPAIIVLGIWFLTQLTNGLGTLNLDTTGGVAWFAHIGGFIAGVGFNFIFQHIKIKEF